MAASIFGCEAGIADWLDQSALDKTQVFTIADDDVIKHFDPHDLAGFFQAAGNGDIFVAGGRVSGRMVVKQDDGSG